MYTSSNFYQGIHGLGSSAATTLPQASGYYSPGVTQMFGLGNVTVNPMDVSGTARSTILGVGTTAAAGAVVGFLAAGDRNMKGALTGALASAGMMSLYAGSKYYSSSMDVGGTLLVLGGIGALGGAIFRYARPGLSRRWMM